MGVYNLSVVEALIYLHDSEQYNKGHWRHNGRDGVSNHQAKRLFIQRFIQAQMKENIKAPRHWPFVSPRWIPRTKGQ